MEKFGSGSGITILDPQYCYVVSCDLLFDFLSLKTDTNVPSKSNNQKTCLHARQSGESSGHTYCDLKKFQFFYISCSRELETGTVNFY
jgi:hypothetical protein